ncbi:UNVERIFIED_CONTAM: hypothetical protein PYX00_005007 [Menopon gallinae]|uniref:Nudix hydrolase domain-containing protein n=1 Tax=Menopon gallinae TaxID=328185 RepID=A0AAW2I6R1_9NEOP
MVIMEQRMSRLLQLAERFNCFYLTGLRKGECRPFIVEGHQVGLIRPDIMKTLLRYPEIFVMQPDCIELNPAFRDYDERTNRIEKVLRECREKNDFVALKAWREECYDVKGGFSELPLLKMDRSATCLFGIRNYAVDINGYVKHPELGLCIWLQRRSTTKQTWPGKWDNMVSGGLSVGYGIMETAIKEAYEEASIPRSLMDNIKAVGSVSFYFESERGLFPNTEFVFDLELPLDFVPSNNDGEVDKFELLPVDVAIERILSQDFKTTSAPVVIDFLIRHGHVTPENGNLFSLLLFAMLRSLRFR